MSQILTDEERRRRRHIVNMVEGFTYGGLVFGSYLALLFLGLVHDR